MNQGEVFLLLRFPLYNLKLSRKDIVTIQNSYIHTGTE